MRIANRNSSPAELKRLEIRCTNPSSCADSMLGTAHVATSLTKLSNDETSSNAALHTNRDDQSVLAQYLLYRF
jgi:hypothetical protein